MALTRQKKEEIIGKLREKFARARVVAFVLFHGLNVQSAHLLRRALRAANAEYFVAKKTLGAKVMDEAAIAGDRVALDGEIAFVFGYDDMVPPMRELYKFQKTHKGKIAIIGGVFERTYRDQQIMIAIATIPSREVLIGQLIGMLASPLRGLADVLQGTPRNFIFTLQAIAQSKDLLHNNLSAAIST